MVYVSFGKAVCAMTSGSIALVPSSAQAKTDVKVLIKGAYYPVILRRIDSQEKAFSFVGICFDGRGVSDLPNDSDVTWQDIAIH